MKPNLKALLWAVALAAGFLFSASSPAHAQTTVSLQCGVICPTSACSTFCFGRVNGNLVITTCGQSGYSCLPGASPKSAHVAQQMITTTSCEGSTSASFQNNTEATAGATSANCPAEHASGSEDLTFPVCPGRDGL